MGERVIKTLKRYVYILCVVQGFVCDGQSFPLPTVTDWKKSSFKSRYLYLSNDIGMCLAAIQCRAGCVYRTIYRNVFTGYKVGEGNEI